MYRTYLIFEWVNGARGKQLTAIMAIGAPHVSKYRAWKAASDMFPGKQVHAVEKEVYDAEMAAIQPQPAA